MFILSAEVLSEFEELALASDGSIDKEIDAFKLKLNLEIKKPIEQQRFPLYLAKVDSLQYYIVLSPTTLWCQSFIGLDQISCQQSSVNIFCPWSIQRYQWSSVSKGRLAVMKDTSDKPSRTLGNNNNISLIKERMHLIYKPHQKNLFL